ncbi:MAG: BamA/TamA family outer membrane protein [Prevotella sp.]|nr:BamA/TamA family outer membrane protein [Prevotella sp.]
MKARTDHSIIKIVRAKGVLPFYLFTLLLLSSCSLTKNIPDDDQLFRGLKEIVYIDEQDDSQTEDKTREAQEATMKEEIEAALATIPNGSLFFSSYYAAPWSWRLWVYNTYASKDSKFAKWMTKSFGKPPVLMSQVNPTLRASVATSVLRNYGYFRGNVTYEPVPMKNPKKSKLRYTVRLDSLFTVDSVAYIGFTDSLQQLIDSTRQETLIPRGSPFSVSALDGERNRISSLFRNNGYYYFIPSYTTYFADTIAVPNKTQLRLQMVDGLAEETLKKWYIGHIDVQFRKMAREILTDSIQRRHLTIHFNGDNSPIRPRTILKDLTLRPRQPFSQEKYQESASKINATGVFSSTDFIFTPRAGTDSLDLTLNCVFDKPYDFYFGTNIIGRTIGRWGPEVKIGFTKRNAFKGGEKLDINLHGSNEWQSGGGSDMNTFQYGADVSLEFPRIIAPFYNSEKVRRDKNGRPKPRRFISTPTTYAKISTDVVRRPEYYKMHVVSGEWTYRWQTSLNSRHEFSPITLTYQYMNSTTEKFNVMRDSNTYLLGVMEDKFIPKMRYTYTYTSPSSYRNPIRWETTLEEAGNIVSLWDRLGGHSFNEKNKKLFKNPYSQFLRLETDLTKSWSLNTMSTLVGHINAGVLWCYGNSNNSPFSEMFYAGGANSIRAFPVREVGPGEFTMAGVRDRQFAYLVRNGDLKLVANLEYRQPLFGNLHGAVFIDIGNTWRLKSINFGTKEEWSEDDRKDLLEDYETLEWYFDLMKFKPSRFLNDIAVGTGFGLRYDLGFLVIRVDWGFALHNPETALYTKRTNYFNFGSFKDMQTLHFAIGYPF